MRGCLLALVYVGCGDGVTPATETRNLGDGPQDLSSTPNPSARHPPASHRTGEDGAGALPERGSQGRGLHITLDNHTNGRRGTWRWAGSGAVIRMKVQFVGGPWVDAESHIIESPGNTSFFVELAGVGWQAQDVTAIEVFMDEDDVHSDNLFLIDQVTLHQLTGSPKWKHVWGYDNAEGWCLSSDPDDNFWRCGKEDAALSSWVFERACTGGCAL